TLQEPAASFHAPRELLRKPLAILRLPNVLLLSPLLSLSSPHAKALLPGAVLGTEAAGVVSQTTPARAVSAAASSSSETVIAAPSGRMAIRVMLDLPCLNGPRSAAPGHCIRRPAAASAIAARPARRWPLVSPADVEAHARGALAVGERGADAHRCARGDRPAVAHRDCL